MAILEDIKTAVVECSYQKAAELTKQALEEGFDPVRIFDEALIPAMDVVGHYMSEGEYYLPEVVMSAKAMAAAADLLKPLIAQAGGSKPKGKVVIGTVNGDLHDIGKNLVIMLLEGAGFQVVDLGTNTPSSAFVEAVSKEKPQVVGMSALLTATMVRMKDVIDSLEEAGIRNTVKIMVGGACLTPDFADNIGADGYGKDAAGAVDLVKKWVS